MSDPESLPDFPVRVDYAAGRPAGGREGAARHEHNPWLCPAHVESCDCPAPDGSLCNPYHIGGFCPDNLNVMPR